MNSWIWRSVHVSQGTHQDITTHTIFTYHALKHFLQENQIIQWNDQVSDRVKWHLNRVLLEENNQRLGVDRLYCGIFKRRTTRIPKEEEWENNEKELIKEVYELFTDGFSYADDLRAKLVSHQTEARWLEESQITKHNIRHS